jgi:hypothetical protein
LALAWILTHLFTDNNNNNNDNKSDAPASTPAPKPTGDSNNNNDNNNNDNNDNNNDNKSGDNNDKTASQSKQTGTPTGNPSGSKTTKKPSKSTSFDPRLPAGGITMVTPNALAGSQYYKVGDWITFAWNYTSLSVTPTAIDVLASCTANQATYTIAVNMSATETEVLWNTRETPDGQAPFLTENYKLLIYDSSLSATAPPRAGYLGAFSGFTFGMYLPQPYVSLQGRSFPVSLLDRTLRLTSHRWLVLPQLQRRFLQSRANDTHNHVLHLRNHHRLAALFHISIRPVVMNDSVRSDSIPIRLSTTSSETLKRKTRSLVAYDNGIPSLRFTPVNIYTCIQRIFSLL